jgi:hypothetical protein
MDTETRHFETDEPAEKSTGKALSMVADIINKLKADTRIDPDVREEYTQLLLDAMFVLIGIKRGGALGD